MPTHSKTVLMMIVALAAALPAAGQLSANCPRCTQVQRQPYMAEFKITNVQTLADGTTITRETQEVEALDSQGRRLNANSMPFPVNQENVQVLHTNVQDPVENTQASWDSRTKEARVTKLPPQDQRHGCWANDAENYHMNYGPIRPQGSLYSTGGSAAAGSGGGFVGSVMSSSNMAMPSAGVSPSPSAAMPVAAAPGVSPTVPPVHVPNPAVNRPVREDLGTDVIQGVEVHGYRSTTTIPAGRIGNDRPIVSTNEYWTAPSLGGLTLRSVNDSPQSGKQMREVTSLSIGDPDPSVFQPPEGYKVKVEEMHEVPCQQQ
jgi:hypothetical protein